MTWFQFWTSAISWPINIGGKPWNSLPAFAPPIFEMMVLLGGVGTVIVLFAVSRLWPGKRAEPVVPGTTDDRFALVVEHETAAKDVDEVRRIFQSSRPLSLEERVLNEAGNRAAGDEGTGEPDRSRRLRVANGVLAVLLLVLAVVIVFGARNPTKPNWEVFREMYRSPARTALAKNNVLPGKITFQDPPRNTVARGLLPLHYEATEESAVRAGEELENPFKPDEKGVIDTAVIERGQIVFARYCACCHGPSGAGDGKVSRRGFPPPPSYAVGTSAEMKDGQIFHMLTYGWKNMPSHAAQVPREDRWKVILYVRQLQAKAKAELAKAEEAAKAEQQKKDKKATDRKKEEGQSKEAVRPTKANNAPPKAARKKTTSPAAAPKEKTADDKAAEKRRPTASSQSDKPAAPKTEKNTDSDKKPTPKKSGDKKS